MLIEELIARVLRKLPEGDPKLAESLIPTIEANLEDALGTLADMAIDDPELKAHLSAQFTTTITTGVATLPASLLVASVPFAYITIEDVPGELEFYSAYRDYMWGNPHPECPRFTLREAELLARVNSEYSITDGSTVTIEDGIGIPTLANIHVDLEDRLVDLLAAQIQTANQAGA
jgi:hypothetical protein